MKPSIRNIVIFGVVTFGCGFLGYAVNTLVQAPDPMQSLGFLIWLVSPLVANLLLRSVGKEGWNDFGIGLNLKSGWKWYLAALLIVPVITLATLAVGLIIRTTAVTAGQGGFFVLVGGAFVGSMVNNLFEEFAWRGYLTPPACGAES